MQQRKSRVVVDSNVWISYIIGGLNTPLDKLLNNESVELLSTAILRDEIFEVLKRKKFKRWINPEMLPIFELVFDNATVPVKLKSQVTMCRDEKDNFLLSLCKDGKADFLITGDEDLLILKNFEKTRILKLSDFLNGTSTL